jgi:hypothetical protein
VFAVVDVAVAVAITTVVVARLNNRCDVLDVMPGKILIR